MTEQPGWLKEIRDREQRATPGPWNWSPGRITAANGTEFIFWAANIPAEPINANAALGACGMHAEEHAEDNLAFLAAARQDVPALLAEIGRLTSALAGATAANRLEQAAVRTLAAERDEAREIARGLLSDLGGAGPEELPDWLVGDCEGRGTGCCARDGIDCVSCMTGRCHECSECVHYDDSARDDEDDYREDED